MNESASHVQRVTGEFAHIGTQLQSVLSDSARCMSKGGLYRVEVNQRKATNVMVLYLLDWNDSMQHRLKESVVDLLPKRIVRGIAVPEVRAVLLF